MNTRFSSRIVDLAVLSGLSIDRPDIDDAAEVAGAHAVDDRAAHIETGADIGVDDGLPLLRFHLVQCPVARDPRVVDEHFHRSQIFSDACNAFGALFKRGNVEFVTTYPRLLRESFGGGIVAVVGRGHNVTSIRLS